ncbi:MAG: ATP-binding protein [Bacillota bacterium]|nr:ATP-binding protein [Bacillota bacterium]
MPIEDIKQFFPDYSILGGGPHYLLTFDNKKNIEDNIKEKILAKGTFLYDEVQMLMRQELREHSIYFTLLEATAMGNTKLNRIYQITQIEKTKIATYLKKLIYLDIVEREYPATEKTKRRVNVQSGLYKIKNDFFRFYFKYLFPNTSLLELHAIEQVYQKMIDQDINIHISQVFEGVCRNHIMKLNIHNQLPIFVIYLGRWWYKRKEIDVMAFDSDKNIYLESVNGAMSNGYKNAQSAAIENREKLWEYHIRKNFSFLKKWI